jgi:hypothetical protein
MPPASPGNHPGPYGRGLEPRVTGAGPPAPKTAPGRAPQATSICPVEAPRGLTHIPPHDRHKYPPPLAPPNPHTPHVRNTKKETVLHVRFARFSIPRVKIVTKTVPTDISPKLGQKRSHQARWLG